MANPYIPVQRPILGGRRNRFGSEERVVTLARQPPRWLSGMRSGTERKALTVSSHSDPLSPIMSPTNKQGDREEHCATCCTCSRKSSSPTSPTKVPLPTSPRLASPISPESHSSSESSTSSKRAPDYILQIEMDVQSSNAVANALNDMANGEGNIYKFVVYADSSLVVVWGSIDSGSLLEMLKLTVDEVTVLQAKEEPGASTSNKQESPTRAPSASPSVTVDRQHEDIEAPQNSRNLAEN